MLQLNKQSTLRMISAPNKQMPMVCTGFTTINITFRIVNTIYELWSIYPVNHLQCVCVCVCLNTLTYVTNMPNGIQWIIMHNPVSHYLGCFLKITGGAHLNSSNSQVRRAP